MADTYANWAALAAAETEGVAYRLEVTRRPSAPVSHLAIHGGGLEAGTSEVASAVAAATGGAYYSMVALLSSGNSRLHITSTHYDEPQALAIQATVTHTVSYHGASGAVPVTHMGGGDAALRDAIAARLAAAGFTVDTATEEIDGDAPLNVANRNRSGTGVQLEISTAQRQAFFPGGVTTRAVRESGQRTPVFWAYVAAVQAALTDQGLVAAPGAGPAPEQLTVQTRGGTRVLFCDLRTDRLIDILPVDGLEWDTYVTGKVGTLRGTIPAPSTAMGRRCMRLLPARTAVWLEQDGRIVWGGILWTRTPMVDDRGRASMPIQAAGWESYFDHRILYDSLTGTGVDQLDIARQLVSYAQSVTGGDIGVEIDYTQTSGVLRDRTYSRYDHGRVRQRLDELGSVEGGFEWRIHSYRDDAGARHKQLQLGYPRITAGSADLVLDYPGPVLSFALPEDAGGMATAWQSRGASTNQNQASESTPLLSPLLTYPDLISAGWPRLDGSSDYTTVTSQAILDEHARADIARARETRLIPEVTISLQGGRPVPPMGTIIRLRIVHPVWCPAGLTVRHRVVGASVRPPTRGARPTARLYLEEVA